MNKQDTCAGSPPGLSRNGLEPAYTAMRAFEKGGSQGSILGAAARLLDAVQDAILEIEDALSEANSNAYPACCGRSDSECCGCPEPEWSDADQAIMDALGPIHNRLSRAVLEARKSGIRGEKLGKGKARRESGWILGPGYLPLPISEF